MSYKKNIFVMNVRTILFLGILSLFPRSAAMAQNVSLPYFNGWEDMSENAEWTMNSGINGSTASNRWYISSKEHFQGSHSLLISDLSIAPDTTSVYSNSTVNIVAAREFNLPVGTYDLSFAWRAYGEKDFDGLHVAWIPVNSDISTSLSSMQMWVKTAAPYKGQMFYNEMTWTVEKTTITSQGRPMLLAFLWVNDNKNAASPSVCIDNVQIGLNSCGAPVGLSTKVDGKDVELSWTANPNVSYDVWYTSDYAGVSDTITNVRGGKVSLPDMPRGAYNFFVRTICAPGDTGIWYSHMGVIVNEGLCLDYTNLRGEGVTCYIGDVNNQYQEVFVDDKGINGAPPRHTVNTDIYETDPRTGGKLKVIPDGEFISVRLGNEEPYCKGEAIVYDMHLDSGANTVLLMKYAVVLQVPDAHPEEAMPWFKLEILDADGNEIDPTCGSIYFFSDLTLLDEGWYQHDIYIEGSGKMEPLIYKDWTTMGLMLGDYAKNGPTDIKIRLTTRDCTQNAHFGYAYFTLDCIEGEIQGLSCGDIPTEEVSAPEGFNYKWYRADDPAETMVSDSMVLEVEPGDVGTYICNVISKENANCYFPMTVSLLPRYPKAVVEPVWSPENCSNFLRLNNLSYIETEEGRTDEEITDFEWTLDDGTTSTEKNLVLPVPDAGDTLHISLKASIVDGKCWDVWDSTIVVPAIGERRDTTFVTICKGGQPYVINGMPYYDTEDVELPPVRSLVTGCDSVHVVSITAVDSYETEIDTTICYGDTLYVGDDAKYWFTGDFKKILRSAGGCDSVVNVALTVLPEVTFGVDVRNVSAGPNSGAIFLKDTLPGTWYTLDGEVGAPLDSLPVGSYTIICYDSLGCQSEPLTVEITAECLEAEVGVAGEICADDSVFYLPVEVTSGELHTYGLRFGDKAKAAGFVDADGIKMETHYVKVQLPDSVTPDEYEVSVVLVDASCGNDTVVVPFSVLYPADIMKQKWNNVVALKNELYNGGYVFSSYQWYRNGTPMDGETGSYIYLGEGVAFAEGDEFRVEVTRASDGVRLMSCPLLVEPHEDVQTYPSLTVVGLTSPVPMENVGSPVRVRIWSVAGIYYGEQEVSPSHPYFVAPDVPGVYVLKIESGGESALYRIIVKR